MLTKQGFSLFIVFTLGLVLTCGPLTTAFGGQEEAVPEIKLNIDGYVGILQKMEIPVALAAIKDLKVGDPPFLKELENADDYGIVSVRGGVLQKGDSQAQVYRIHFASEEKADSALEMKKKSGTKRAPLMVEDPMNCRTPEFGLYCDGKNWSGFRREKEVLVLIKGAVSQEEFFRFMEKAI